METMMAENDHIASLRLLLGGDQLACVVGRNLQGIGASPADRYRAFAERLDAKRFVVPVAGVQGAGKSCLLNAIAFPHPVLPIDVAETTAVPVEIAYAPTPSGKATVFFQDGRTAQISADEDALAEFVHNDQNPGNRKGVDRIVLESDCPQLETGLVLVDLPGIGAITQANVETTRRYLQEAVGVLFLLRTVPPITRSEALFVTANWARLPMAFFVLNRWADERDEEVENALDFVVTNLSELAARNHIRLVGPPPVDVVAAYRALEGRLKCDESLLLDSGLPGLLDRLGSEAHEWPTRVANTIAQSVLSEVEAALAGVERQIADLTDDRSQVNTRLTAEEARFQEYIAKLEQLWAEALDDVAQVVKSHEAHLDEWEKAAQHTLRNKMREKMRGGIVDGARLDKALRDEQGREEDTAFEQVQEGMLAFQDRIQERFKNMSAWAPSRPAFRVAVGRPEKKKYENVIPPAAGSAAGIGAGVGGMWAGAKIGALLGSAGGPIGTAVGGFLGGLLGAWLGSKAGGKAKEAITNRRASNAEPEVFAAIDHFTDACRAQLCEQVQRFGDGVRQGLAAWKAEQRARYESERAQTVGALELSLENRNLPLARLGADEEVLRAALAALRVVR